MGDVRAVWDKTEVGLTVGDFAKWPGQRPFKRRDSHAKVLGEALDQRAMTLPVYLVGECTTYDIAHGHPSFPAARHDGVFFAVSGKCGTPWPRITCFRKRPTLLPDFDHVEMELVELFPAIGYVDLQLSHDGSPVGRIGFSYFKDAPTTARARANAVLAAILKCRNGLLPNQ